MSDQGEGDENVQLVQLRPDNVESLTPLPIKMSNDRSIRAVAAGKEHYVYLTDEGRCYSSTDPQGGEGPANIAVNGTGVAVGTGSTFTAVLTEQGQVYVWGKILNGSEVLLQTTAPSLITAPEKIEQMAVGSNYVIALGESKRKIFVYGSNSDWAIGKEKKSQSAKLFEEYVINLDKGSSIVGINTWNYMTTVVTSNNCAFVFGGKKKFRQAQRVDGVPDMVNAAFSPSYGICLDKKGDLFRRSNYFGKSDWTAFGDEVFSAQMAFFGNDDICLVQQKGNGKVSRLNCKSGECVQVNTIRVSSFSTCSHNAIFIFAVTNSRQKVFEALYPEPLLKIATAKGFVQWLARTGCRFNSDYLAFEFALSNVMKLAGKKNKSMIKGKGGNNPVKDFLELLRKNYNADDKVARQGVCRLFKVFLLAPSTSPQQSRYALQVAQSFIQEADLTLLWNVENGKANIAQTIKMPSSSSERTMDRIDLEDVVGYPVKTVAAVLTNLRTSQFLSISSENIVRFAMISPDPSSFELFPNVAEFVDIGNTMGRWAKEFIVKGHSKKARAERMRFLYNLLLELESLRNFDLCFHLSGALLWELLPDLAKEAKVDLEGMMPVVKKFGDRKFWNGVYQQKLQDEQPLIPLLVYHSNLISGGAGGVDSVQSRGGERYLNVAKFRNISAQLRLLRRIKESTKEPPVPGPEPALLDYFATVQALNDADLTKLRSEIIPVSKFRESAKVTSLEQFSSDLVSSLSAVERRLIKWNQLIQLLESNDATVRLRKSPFMVCPRDAVFDGDLIGPSLRALCTKAADIEWLSTDYWLLRRILSAITGKFQFEDLILAFSRLLLLTTDSLPQKVDSLVSTFSDFVAGKQTLVAVIRNILTLQETAKTTLPDLEKNVTECEIQLEKIKEEDAKLSRRASLMTISSTSGLGENATIRAVKKNQTDLEGSTKLRKAKLEHFMLQRDCVKAVQSECREFAISLDLWNSHIVKTKADFHHNFQVVHHYFVVIYIGSKWAEGENSSYVHHEADALSKQEFEDKLKSLYGSMFGDELSFVELANVNSAKDKGIRCGIAFHSVRATKTANMFETEVTISGKKKYSVYEVEKATQKQRYKVVRTSETALEGVQSQIDDFQARSGVLYDECEDKVPTERLVRILTQAMNPSSSWYQSLVNANATQPELIRAIYDYLQALRQGLSVLALTSDEDQARNLLSLTKDFVSLTKRVIPELGAPPVGANNKAAYTHKSIYNYVMLYATEDDELVAPATVRTSHRRAESISDKPRRPSMTAMDAANSSISLASPQVTRHSPKPSMELSPLVSRPERKKNQADVLARSLEKPGEESAPTPKPAASPVDPMALLSPPKTTGGGGGGDKPKSPKSKQQEDLWKELQGKVASPKGGKKPGDTLRTSGRSEPIVSPKRQSGAKKGGEGEEPTGMGRNSLMGGGLMKI